MHQQPMLCTRRTVCLAVTLLALLLVLRCPAAAAENAVEKHDPVGDHYVTATERTQRQAQRQFTGAGGAINRGETLQRTEQRDSDGSYRYEYLTDNGIHRQESAQQFGADRIVRGSYSYIGPDNRVYTVNYVADRNGYRAYGAHLPTQPDAVANIINQQPNQQQQQQLFGVTTLNPRPTTIGFVPSSTIRPIYQRPTSHGSFGGGRPTHQPSYQQVPAHVVAVTPSSIPSGISSSFNTFGSSTPSSAFYPVATTLAPPSFGSQGFNNINNNYPLEFGNNQYTNAFPSNNLFGSHYRPSSISNQTPQLPISNLFNIVDGNNGNPNNGFGGFGNDGGRPQIVHITPAPQTSSSLSQFQQQQLPNFGIAGAFNANNGNNPFFVQQPQSPLQFSAFGRDEPHDDVANNVAVGSRQSKYAAVQPLNGGGESSSSSSDGFVPSSAFDRRTAGGRR